MLQISTGKFFDTTEFYETTHRGVLYTNQSLLGERPMETLVGKILPATRWGDIGVVTCEIFERQPKYEEGLKPGLLISTGPDAFINDFAAVTSFALQATFTPDHDLAMRLLTAQRPPLGISAAPRKYISKVFDKEPQFDVNAPQTLSHFIAELMALERKYYVGAIRAIRRYVTAMHRIGDDLDLAYSLFVAAIESLAQEFDGFEPEWSDYDQRKRVAVDVALEGAADGVASSVRKAILDAEHVAIGRRFREFSLAHLGREFFRSEAKTRAGAIGRGDLEAALKRAYELRSGYVHSLRPLPKMLAATPTTNDVMLVDGKPLLTFEGLARVARSVIEAFIARSPKTEREKHDVWAEYPNLLTAPLAPRYWIGNIEGFTSHTVYHYLNGFFSEIQDSLLDSTKPVTDIGSVCGKIESLLPSLAKPEQRRPMLTLHCLFFRYLSSEEQQAAYERVKRFASELDVFSPESFFIQVLNGRVPEYAPEACETLLRNYIQERYAVGRLNVGSILGAAGALTVAEMYRATDPAASRRLVEYAVDQFPGLVRLHGYLEGLPGTDIAPIRWWDILLPDYPRTTQSDDSPA